MGVFKMTKLSGLAKVVAVGFLALGLAGCPAPAPSPTTDTEAPTIPTNFSGISQGNGEILFQWKESSDNVGVTQYQMKISIYNAPNPASPIDASDISDVAALPTPVSPSTTLNKLVNSLDSGVDYTAYIRAGDAAGNFSDWAKVVDVISGGFPTIPYEPYGKIQGGAIPNGKTVSANDKYGNVIDKKVAPYGVTNGGWYGLMIENRKMSMPVTIVCQDYTPTAAATNKSGSEEIDF